jgi:hypothetical protein
MQERLPAQANPSHEQSTLKLLISWFNKKLPKKESKFTMWTLKIKLLISLPKVLADSRRLPLSAILFKALITHSSSVWALFLGQWDTVSLEEEKIQASEGIPCQNRSSLITSTVNSSSLMLASRASPLSYLWAVLLQTVHQLGRNDRRELDLLSALPVGLRFGARRLNLSLRVSQSRKGTRPSLSRASQKGVLSICEFFQARDPQWYLRDRQPIEERWSCCPTTFLCSSCSILLPIVQVWKLIDVEGNLRVQKYSSCGESSLTNKG